MVLQAAGDISAGFAQGLTRNVAPALEGLSERLARPGATFLDVGVGVASLAIAMARLCPELRIVGVDPWQPSLRLARENVDRAGLGDRIELREQGGETLEDEAAFDLAWLATAFMPERLIPARLRPRPPRASAGRMDAARDAQPGPGSADRRPGAAAGDPVGRPALDRRPGRGGAP